MSTVLLGYSAMLIIKYLPTLQSGFLSPPLKFDFNPEDETLVTIYQSKQHYITKDLNVHYLVYKRLPRVPVRKHMSVFHKLTPYFFNIPFHIVSPYTTRHRFFYHVCYIKIQHAHETEFNPGIL